jgi:hypothetical protein
MGRRSACDRTRWGVMWHREIQVACCHRVQCSVHSFLSLRDQVHTLDLDRVRGCTRHLRRLQRCLRDAFLEEIIPMNIWIIIRTFIAFFLALFGVAVMAGADQQRALVGALLAALGLTFLWRLWLAMQKGL